MRFPLAVLALSLPALPAFAQTNAVPGTDVMAFDVGGPSMYGRRGAAYPNGEAVMNIGHSMCNAGTVPIPWNSSGPGGTMANTYPKIATMIAREFNGRMQQISGLSYCKHSRTPFNFTSGACIPCQSSPSAAFRVGCSDTYSAGFSSIGNLGPTTEIDPWTGIWNPIGSYFDRGDPDVGLPGNADGVQSTINGDNLKNRMVVQESDLAGGGTFYGQAQICVIGEPGTNRANNAASRPLTFTWNGTSWSVGVTGTAAIGPVLTRWTGASTAVNGNGVDDGRFMVGWKVTDLGNGYWHYEYAVHNLDNNRGAASLRVPVCTSAHIINSGFHDIDTNVLNNWTYAPAVGEVAWQATANNAIEWNSLYNFWFDCDAAPVPGTVSIDEARPGPGALTVDVAADVPGLGNRYLGAGCGSPAPSLFASGRATIPNPTFSLRIEGMPFTISVLVVSTGGLTLPLGNGCTSYLDTNQIVMFDYILSEISGTARWNLPIPAFMQPFQAFCQGAQFVTGGPFLNDLALTNALLVPVGGTVCP